MKTFITLLAVFSIALFYTSCNDEGSIINSPVNQTGDYKIFTMSGEADGETAAPAGLDKPYRHFVGEGTNTPGGVCEIVMDYWAITNMPPPPPISGTADFGTGTITTESGDKIYGLITEPGTWNMDANYIVTGNVPLKIAGGTGEYDNIVGEVALSFTMNNITRVTHAEWTGTFHRAKPFSGTGSLQNATVTGSCISPYISRRATGNVIATHFGKTFVEMSHCVDFSTGVMKDGDGIFNAPSGHKLYTDYDGYVVPTSDPNIVNVLLIAEVSGGSGKYEDATGYIFGKGFQNLTTGEVTINLLEGAVDW